MKPGWVSSGGGKQDVSASCSISLKRHRDQDNSYKGECLIRAGLQFRGLVHYHHGRKHGSVQADMVLEKELRVLHLDPLGSRKHWV